MLPLGGWWTSRLLRTGIYTLKHSYRETCIQHHTDIVQNQLIMYCLYYRQKSTVKQTVWTKSFFNIWSLINAIKINLIMRILRWYLKFLWNDLQLQLHFVENNTVLIINISEYYIIKLMIYSYLYVYNLYWNDNHYYSIFIILQQTKTE